MVRFRNDALVAAAAALVAVAALLLLLLPRSPFPGGEGSAPGVTRRETEQAQEVLSPNKARAVREKGLGTQESSPEEGTEGEDRQPLLSGTVYGAAGALGGASVMVFPFQAVRALITKYEGLSIGGFPDLKALVGQVRRDIMDLRSWAVTAKTDAEGIYAFYDLKPGEYVCVVFGPGHIFRAGDTTVIAAGERRRLDFVLKRGHVIAGRVVGAGGAPVAEASVLALPQVGAGGLGKIVRRILSLVNGQFLRGPFEDQSGPEGGFRLDCLPPGAYELHVVHPQYASACIESVQTGTKDLVIQLGEGSTVLCRLLREDGTPASFVEALLVDEANKTNLPLPIPQLSDLVDQIRRLVGEEDRSASSDTDGRVRFTNVPPGRYRFVVDSPGFLPYRQDLALSGEETVDLGSIVLDRGAAIQGKVITEDGVAVPEAVVTAQVQGGRNPIAMVASVRGHLAGKFRTICDGKGEFVLSGLNPKMRRWRVVAFKEKSGMGSAQGVEPDGEPVTVVLKQPWFVKGTVIRAATKKPVEGAEVLGGGAQAATDPEGRFVLGPALPEAAPALFGGGELRLGVVVRAEGMSPERLRLTQEECREEIVVQLREEAAVEGIVRKPDGDPQPGALLRLVPGRLPPVGGFDLITLGVTFADAGGRFRFGALRFGMDLRAVALFPGFAQAESEPFRLTPERQPEFVELVLQRGGWIAGRVTDGRNPLQGVKVRLCQAEERNRMNRAAFFLKLFGLPEAGKVTYTDTEGAFVYRDLTPGAYTITASVGNGIAKTVRVQVEPEKQSEVLIELELGGRISGVVVDPKGDPIAFATVRLLDAGNQSLLGLQRAFRSALVAQTTDDAGTFLFEQVKEGRYVLAAEHEGFAPREVSGVVVDHEPYRIVLEPEGSIVGVVKLAGSGEVVPEFRARLQKATKGKRWDSPLKAWRFFSDPEGVFRYTALAEGTYQIEVRAEGAAPGVVEVSVASGGESFVEVYLKKPGTIQGQVVVGDDKRPVAGARVAIVASEASGRPGSAGEAFGGFMEERMKEIASFTDGEGNFTLNEVPAGTHTLEATHTQWRPARVEVAVQEGGLATCTICLREGFDCEGVLLNHQEQPEPQRALLLQGPGNIQKVARSGEDGRWLFQGLKAGTYRIWCPTPDLSRDAPPVVVEVKDDVAGIKIVLPPPPDEAPPGEEPAGEVEPPQLPPLPPEGMVR